MEFGDAKNAAGAGSSGAQADAFLRWDARAPDLVTGRDPSRYFFILASSAAASFL